MVIVQLRVAHGASKTRSCAVPESCVGSDLLLLRSGLVLIRLVCLLVVGVFGWLMLGGAG
jgi:hypothetical protein